MPSIKVQGMKCQHCAGSTRKALEDINGISNVQVDLDKGEVSFDGDADHETIKAAIAGAGFQLVE
jgi:copper chaperone